MPRRRATTSLTEEILGFVDTLAAQQSTNRSAIIADLVRDKQDATIKSMMADGYRVMSDENLRDAEVWLMITRDVILRDRA